MLNKNGWGIKTVIGFIALFCFCLIVIAIGVNRMFGSQGITNNYNNDNYEDIGEEYNESPDEIDDYYVELESNAYKSAAEYISDNKNEFKDFKIISIKKLITNGYLTSFEDLNNNECGGYVEVFGNNNDEHSVYITCPNYETSGYDERKDKNA